MEERKVITLNKFSEKLIGLEMLPTTKQEKYPTAILVHGFGVTKEESGMFDDIAHSLADEGFLVYRFDFSGCGESEGDYSETSLTKLRSDLSSILDFVQSEPQVDSSRIGILGQSFGTATTITLKPKVRCLIMTGSVSHPKESLIKLFADGYNPDGISTRLRSSGRITKVKPEFWRDFDNHNLLESIKEIHTPILFIHGSEDEKCPLSEMEAYFENANEPKEKVIIQGAAHSFLPHRDKLYKLVVDWFKKYLIPSLYQKVEQFVVDSFTKAGNTGGIKHFKRTVYWVQQLKSDADEALLIAAIAHDIERAFREPTYDKEFKKGFRTEEHLTYHQKKGAKVITDFLRKQSADEKLVERVEALISKHEIGGDSDQDILKDADSVSFFENNVDHFVTKLVPKVGRENVKDKFDWMFNRITNEKAKKIVSPWYREATKRLGF